MLNSVQQAANANIYCIHLETVQKMLMITYGLMIQIGFILQKI